MDSTSDWHLYLISRLEGFKIGHGGPLSLGV